MFLQHVRVHSPDKPRTVRRYGTVLEHASRILGRKTIDTIKPPEIDDYKNARSREVSKQHKNRPIARTTGFLALDRCGPSLVWNRKWSRVAIGRERRGARPDDVAAIGPGTSPGRYFRARPQSSKEVMESAVGLSDRDRRGPWEAFYPPHSAGHLARRVRSTSSYRPASSLPTVFCNFCQDTQGERVL
jgi:hypothetical protein